MVIIIRIQNLYSARRALDLSCVVPTVWLPAIRPIVTVITCLQRKFANSRAVYYSNNDASFNVQLYTLLLLSGDVYASPRPSTTNTYASTRRPSSFIEHGDGDGHLAGSCAQRGLRSTATLVYTTQYLLSLRHIWFSDNKLIIQQFPSWDYVTDIDREVSEQVNGWNRESFMSSILAAILEAEKTHILTLLALTRQASH